MAVIAFTVSTDPSFGQRNQLITWTNVLKTDTTSPFQQGSLADRSVQVGGTFDSGTVVLEGSNDGVTYFTLTDPAGVALSFTSAGFKQVLQVCKYMRAGVSGGTAPSITINLFVVGK